jgi:hypothetical protein
MVNDTLESLVLQGPSMRQKPLRPVVSGWT